MTRLIEEPGVSHEHYGIGIAYGSLFDKAFKRFVNVIRKYKSYWSQKTVKNMM